MEWYGDYFMDASWLSNEENNRGDLTDEHIRELRRLYEDVMRIAEAVNAGIAFGTPFGLVTPAKKVDNQLGGIDLTPANMNLETKMDSRLRGNDSGGIKFHVDPAMLAQLENAPGFTPEIITIQPMTDLKVFLGIIN